MAEPSVEWREVVQPDEPERHERQAARLGELQERISAQDGAGRVLYRRRIAALRATLTVPADLPEYARQGLFEVPETYDAWVRLSSGGLGRAADHGTDDAARDLHGFAIKVLGVRGPAATGGEAVEQDFTLIDRERFGFATSTGYTRLVTLNAEPRLRRLWTLLRTRNLLGPARAQRDALRTPFSGFATGNFFSAAPLTFGPYAVRIRLAAAGDETGSRETAPTHHDWSADLYGRLADGPLNYDFQVQFFTDEQRTPIEDASAAWDAPYETVGRLTIPRQHPDDAFAAEVDAAAFDPWNALAAHRPLGEVMRARRVAYRVAQEQRHAV